MNQFGYGPTKIVIRMNRTGYHLESPTTSYDVFVISQGFKPLLYQNIGPSRLLKVLETVSFEVPIEVEPDLVDSETPTHWTRE